MEDCSCKMNYSIVIPVYNSEGSLEELCSRLHRVMLQYGEFELILVDDGSKDGSWRKMTELKSQYPSTLKIIRLARNFGQHNALSCGFTIASGNFVITMDDDLQHPPEEIPKLITEQKTSGADLVYGIPLNRKHGLIRIAGSYFVTKSSKLMSGNTEGSSFRVIERSLANQMERHQHKSMIYIDEILSWYTGNVTTTDVEHHNRKYGKSGYSTMKLIRLYFDILVNHSAVPLKLMTWIGFIASICSMVLGVYFIIRKYFLKVPVGFTALIVAVLFSASILTMCMGILGQYMNKLFLVQNRRPSFHIKEMQ